MSAVHTAILGVAPDVAFARLAALLHRGCCTGAWDERHLVHLPPASAEPYRVTAVEPPNVLVLERAGAVRHSIVVVPVPGGAEIVWTAAEGPGSAEEVEGVLAVLDVALADASPGAVAHDTPSGCGPRSGAPAPSTVLDRVVLDHAHLRTQLDRLCAETSPPRPAVTALLAAVSRHEAAESALLRPLLRRTDGGPSVAALLDRQEAVVADSRHAVLAAAVAQAPDLQTALTELRTTVLDNCEAEEVAAHPRLRANCSHGALEEVGRRYVAMTRVDPGGHRAWTAIRS